VKLRIQFQGASRIPALILLMGWTVVSETRAAVFIDARAMNTRHAFHTATLLPNGKVLVAGGLSHSHSELFDPITGIWTTTGDMNVPRYYHTATLLMNGKVLVTAGYNLANGNLSSAEIFDPSVGNWTPTPTLGTNRFLHTATLLSNGKVLVVGGLAWNGSDYEYLANSELFNPTNGTWIAAGALGVRRYQHTATLLSNGKVLVAGGYGVAGKLRSSELYDPLAETWTATGLMTPATGRAFHTAVALVDGRVLAIGGDSTSSAEIYDPVTELWTATGSLNNARHDNSAVLLGSGRVLVGGGLNGNTTLSSAESYNPLTGAWTTTPALLPPARRGHTATVLPDGKVLIAGGYNTGTLSNAQLYVQEVMNIANAKTTNGGFQFSFTNGPGSSFDVIATTNPASPISNWIVLQGVTEISSGHYRFVDPQATNFSQRFYRVRSQ
jgi:hypothetical protein